MCPVCSKAHGKKVMVTEQMVKLAKEYSKSEYDEHMRSHFGTKPGVLPLWSGIDWLDVIFCVLHLYLRIVEKLIQVLVWPLIRDEATAQKLIALLQKRGVQFHYVPASEEEDPKAPHTNNFKKHSWIGRHCDIFIAHAREVFDLLFAEVEDQRLKEPSLQLVQTFDAAYEALTHIDDSQVLEPQVVAMQAKIDAFTSLFTKYMPGVSGGLYPHIFAYH